MTQKQKEKAEAIEQLREWIKPGHTVYTSDALYGSVEFFIERNRAGIAAIVRRRLGRQYDHANMTPKELRLWVLNDPELYAWAVREGLKEDA